MRVPFTLLGKRYSYYKKNIIKNFNNISLKGDFILGKNVDISLTFFNAVRFRSAFQQIFDK